MMSTRVLGDTVEPLGESMADVTVRPLGWVAAMSLTFVAILNLVGVWIGTPRLGLLPSLPPGASVDYSPISSGVSPLGERFIRSVLGDDTAPRASTPDAVRPIARRGSSDPAGPLTRIVDDHPLTNDGVASARSVPRPPFTARTNTAQATRGVEDPDDCGSVGGTVWYHYRSTRADDLIANTFGTKQSTTLGVFEGVSGAWRAIGCDTDVQGSAVVAFYAKESQDYYFQVATPTSGGPLVFSLELQGQTTLASVTPRGDPGGNASAGPALSGNGRILVFGSLATDFVPGVPDDPCLTKDPRADVSKIATGLTNGAEVCQQIYARDLLTGETTLVSASSDGEPGNSHSARIGQYSDDRTGFGGAAASGNGRYVAFGSLSNNLVPGDTNNVMDAFVKDLWTGRIERASVDSRERQAGRSTGTGVSTWISISSDGRFVTFQSSAGDLVPGDTNLAADVFVRDRLRGVTTRVSVSSEGMETEPLIDFSAVDDQAPTSAFPMTPCISANGRFVAFRSQSARLVAGDTNNVADIFVHDRVSRRTERVSVGPGGRQADLHSQTWPGCLSADGRYVVFTSRATNLVEGDTNGRPDVFVHDRRLRRTVRVNVASDGRQSETNDALFRARVAVISANGRYVAFHSSASDLVEGDQNTFSDIFIHDLRSGTTTRVSSKPGGGEFTDTDAYNPAISADGRVVAFDAAPVGTYVRSVESLSPPQVYVHVRARSEP